jgi:prepilin-type N-terminal cleavage/methylation domain-containing protein
LKIENGKFVKGFSLVEMVVASTILSMGVITICAISTRSLSRVRLNREREVAWDLLDRQLTMIEYVGVDNFLRAGTLEGKFSAVKNMPEYNWQIVLKEHEITGLIRVYAAVAWGEKTRRRQITAQTVMSGTALADAAATDQQTTDQTGAGATGGAAGAAAGGAMGGGG